MQNHIIHADYAHRNRLYGTGIGVCVLDSGIEQRSDFLELTSVPASTISSSALSSSVISSSIHSSDILPKSRIIAFKDFVNQQTSPYDDAGHGTHICGKIASSANINNEEYLGIAPNCNLIVLKVLDSKGNAPISNLLAAFSWIKSHKQQYNIRIINISIGANEPSHSQKSHILVRAVDELWDEGFIVCASAGNNGPAASSITAPGSSCKIITVGAFDDNQPVSNSYTNSTSSTTHKAPLLYSGRGPAKCNHVKPELVAPGHQIISCTNLPYGYIRKTGTSMATAFVSGAIALLLEQHPEYNNEDVKNRLVNSTRRLNLPHFQQGYGLLDIERLLSNS